MAAVERLFVVLRKLLMPSGLVPVVRADELRADVLLALVCVLRALTAERSLAMLLLRGVLNWRVVTPPGLLPKVFPPLRIPEPYGRRCGA